MRYDDIPPAIIRRALTVWLGSQSDITPVLLRVPESDDNTPYYLINWFLDDQDPDMYFIRSEQIMINTVVSVEDGIHGASSRKTKLVDFFQRGQATVDDCNRFIQYLVSEGATIPYHFKAFEIMDGTEEVTWNTDGLVIETPVFIRYSLTYNAEALPNIQSLNDSQIEALDT